MVFDLPFTSAPFACCLLICCPHLSYLSSYHDVSEGSVRGRVTSNMLWSYRRPQMRRRGPREACLSGPWAPRDGSPSVAATGESATSRHQLWQRLRHVGHDTHDRGQDLVHVGEDNFPLLPGLRPGWRSLQDRRQLRCQRCRNVGSRYGPCLLYTSPSPRDRQKSRMPSSA